MWPRIACPMHGERAQVAPSRPSRARLRYGPLVERYLALEARAAAEDAQATALWSTVS